MQVWICYTCVSHFIIVGQSMAWDRFFCCGGIRPHTPKILCSPVVEWGRINRSELGKYWLKYVGFRTKRMSMAWCLTLPHRRSLCLKVSEMKLLSVFWFSHAIPKKDCGEKLFSTPYFRYSVHYNRESCSGRPLEHLVKFLRWCTVCLRRTEL